MSDLLEAIQTLSIQLSDRIGRLTAARGWAHKPYSWICAEGERFYQIVATTVSFPGGFHASFTPRAEAQGGSWIIDVRRTDGRERQAWANGLRVSKAERGFALLGDGGPLSDEALGELLDELGTA